MTAQATTTPAVPMLAGLDAPDLLNLLADGAYITDLDRNIVFWNQAAERITGWTAEDVVGRPCRDNILVHVDKDGHALCGQDHCPLYRSITTGQPSPAPLLVFAQDKQLQRIPVEVMVSPVRNRAGELIGGIEVFRDLTEYMQDQLRAQRIQAQAVTCPLPDDDRVAFETCYQPRDIVGGDFYHIESIGPDHYAVLVADAMGHGVAAALSTSYLRSLWNEHKAVLHSPGRFVATLNDRLHALAPGEGYFGTAIFATYNAATGDLTCVCAGHPPPLWLRRDGTSLTPGARNPPLGMLPVVHYEETAFQLSPGDAILFFTDGATEVAGSDGRLLGTDGLGRLVHLQTSGVDLPSFRVDRLEQQLLQFSDRIHLVDDLTLVKLRRLR
jgi:sigma-B regulation protein RsbU (phosphoserine phosphatase)